MDRMTIDKINLLHPKIRMEVLKAYEHANNILLGKGVRLRFTHTLRTIKEQNELYIQGRTKLFDANGRHLSIVTNARGGLSVHNYGLAFDFVILLDNNGDGTFETALWNIKTDGDKDGFADWIEIVDYFKKLDWKWGGDWKSFPDYPHLEKTYGLTVKDLLAKYNSGDTFSEIIDGKIYKWINL